MKKLCINCGDCITACPIDAISQDYSGAVCLYPSADVAHPGAFSGIIEKIHYLQDLGVTTVELLQVMPLMNMIYLIMPGISVILDVARQSTHAD